MDSALSCRRSPESHAQRVDSIAPYDTTEYKVHEPGKLLKSVGKIHMVWTPNIPGPTRVRSLSAVPVVLVEKVIFVEQKFKRYQ